MAKKNNLISLSSRGLKHKLMVSSALMSVLPLLVSVYLVSSHILPRLGFKIDILLSLFISAVIAVIGFFVIKEVFDRVLTVASDAKMLAAGDLSCRFSLSSDDEVGDLGNALNRLTERIRSNMEELKTYSEKTTEINLGIQKRVIVLSSILQISSQISQSEKLDDILKVVVEKAKLLASSDLACLFYRGEGEVDFSLKIIEGANLEHLENFRITPADDLFYDIVNSNKALVLDKQGLLSKELSVSLHQKFKLENMLILPVYLRKKVVALLGIGNNQGNFFYNKEDIELLDVFAKQIAIAVENDILLRNVKKLEVKDALTGLYNLVFIHSRLQEEIKRAIVYRRPCAYILVDIDNFKKYAQTFGSLQAETAIKRVAALINDSVSEIDRVGRIGDDVFAVILPEKNKRQAQEIAENIRQKVESAYSEHYEAEKRVTISAAVSENPLDGITSDELIKKAEELLLVAKESGRNRVVIFKES
jgi:diguanylate cyclase (GGDEF)-like protein